MIIIMTLTVCLHSILWNGIPDNYKMDSYMKFTNSNLIFILYWCIFNIDYLFLYCITIVIIMNRTMSYSHIITIASRYDFFTHVQVTIICVYKITEG